MHELTGDALRPAPPERLWGPRDIVKAIAVVIAGVVAVSIPIALAAGAISTAPEVEQDPEGLAALLSSSFVLELLLLGTAFWFSVRKYRLPISALGFARPSPNWWQVALGLPFAAFAIIFLYFAMLSLLGLDPESNLPEEAFDNVLPLVLLALLTLVFAPVCEETFFRGFVFGGLRGRWGVPLAAAVSGLLFGMAHLGNPGSFYLIPPVAAIGAMFALSLAFTGSLATPIVAHFLYNAIAFGIGVASS